MMDRFANGASAPSPDREHSSRALSFLNLDAAPPPQQTIKNRGSPRDTSLGRVRAAARSHSE